MLLRQSLNSRRVQRAKQAYAALIREICREGIRYRRIRCRTCLPNAACIRRFWNRMLRWWMCAATEEYLMLYTGTTRGGVGAGMIWSLGRNVRRGLPLAARTAPAPLVPVPACSIGRSFRETYSRLRATSSTTSTSYNLKGCVRQEFALDLIAMNWSESVVIPRAAVVESRAAGVYFARRHFGSVRTLLYLVLAGVLLVCLALARSQAEEEGVSII